MASQKARHQLCRSCQRHLKLEPKPDEAEAQAFDLQSHLAAATFFLLGTSDKSVNADVYVHDASTTDLNVPRDSYRIGPPDSLLVPIFRLYCFQNGQYAALLPDAPAAVSQQEPALMRVSSCSSQETQDVFGTADAGSSEPSANMEQMREILQRFCDSRGAKVQISKADVRCLQEAWSDRDAEGAGQTLAGTSTSAATNHEGEHLPPTVPIQPNAADSKDDSKESSGQSTDEGGSGMEDRKSGHMHAEGIAMKRTEGDDGDIYL
ncbi:unnamed protein product, partial [Cladocopium goreaui]